MNGTHRVDVSILPTLKTLHVWVDDTIRGLPTLVRLLARLPPETQIHTLIIHFWFQLLKMVDDTEAILQFDGDITGLDTIGSLRVEICTTPWLPADQIHTVRSLLPKLHSRGRLFLTGTHITSVFIRFYSSMRLYSCRR